MTARPPSAPRPAPVVPGYVLEEQLGRGGSGEVWRARPRGGGEPVAVKVLATTTTDGDRDREAALLAELDHPHLVRLLDVVHRDLRGGGTQVALVLELLAGGSLARLLARRGRLRPGEVVTAVAPVAAALAHVHDRGIVHGDLSPGNVVFTAEGRPVLTDLGVGRFLGEADVGRVTPPYVDPVVARGGAAGPASDVFGVAAAAFHALTGIPPWNAAGASDTLLVAAAGLVPDLSLLAPEAPAELVAVVERGMSPHPHLRGSAADFALDLRHACPPERIAMPAAGRDAALLARTGEVPRTELTHQVRRRATGAHAAPATEGWRGRVGRRLLRRPPSAVPLTAVPLTAVPLAAVVRRLVAVGAVTAVLLGAVWLGVQWGRAGVGATAPPAGTVPVAGPPSGTPPAGTPPATSPPATSPPAATSAPSTSPAATPVDAEDWAAVLVQLYQQRAETFAAGAVEGLTRVYSPTSPLLTADAERLAALSADGATLAGFAPEVVDVAAVDPGPDGVVRVRLTDRVPAYAVVEADGGRQEVPGRAARGVEMSLTPTAGGWRIVTAELLPP